ncbi:MAG: hypothetical protein ACK58L_11050 [Planctomycetota bacterium]
MTLLLLIRRVATRPFTRRPKSIYVLQRAMHFSKSRLVQGFERNTSGI